MIPLGLTWIWTELLIQSKVHGFFMSMAITMKANVWIRKKQLISMRITHMPNILVNEREVVRVKCHSKIFSIKAMKTLNQKGIVPPCP